MQLQANGSNKKNPGEQGILQALQRGEKNRDKYKEKNAERKRYQRLLTKLEKPFAYEE